ncbi:4-carboxy-4-hydroxy-2-oxoadipate aldolase/oxaloacetate decarboxylase [Alicyclobacillus cellulosilyticus]|uniref:Putative 4-hydroxy-4-methyl-2-oxoglutarate aldolase n=1 Tax=Alicyclobacillus cellulosilyticus TaxID=1003997 RepID=A0A917KCH5_9BACL|nr:RraA family protein [Alicyclobacillus cellulosilyticus]GGJ08326.1 4-carboxy-4-hydroxy-2-oxoadipate aldolase/oxaloacetate decarboxylase [Alicyclobacillus cellulosilyticus]
MSYKMSRDEREELLHLFEGLRVTDVRDGMDWNMMHHYGSVHYEIRPLWRTRVVGIARTARYIPYETFVPQMSPEEYTEWVAWYYREVCNDPWQADIEPGDIIVIDQSGVDVGILGSNNTLAGFAKGARGYITNGGVRDTDEIIIQKIPVWSKFISQKMDQGRIRFDAKDVPVSIGGVVVYPGDVVVADGDGVIVVPRKIAPQVAKYARQELEKDKAARRRLYEQLGWELDDTVK